MPVMENVPQFLTKYKGATFKEVKRILSKELPEYILVEDVKVLNSVNYGYQKQKKDVFSGSLKRICFRYPKITHWYKGSNFNIDPNNEQTDTSTLMPQ